MSAAGGLLSRVPSLDGRAQGGNRLLQTTSGPRLFCDGSPPNAGSRPASFATREGRYIGLPPMMPIAHGHVSLLWAIALRFSVRQEGAPSCRMREKRLATPPVLGDPAVAHRASITSHGLELDFAGRYGRDAEELASVRAVVGLVGCHPGPPIGRAAQWMSAWKVPGKAGRAENPGRARAAASRPCPGVRPGCGRMVEKNRQRTIPSNTSKNSPPPCTSSVLRRTNCPSRLRSTLILVMTGPLR